MPELKIMTEYDNKLNHALHEHKLNNKLKTYEVAQLAGINKQSLYNFQSGATSLSGENTKKLMDYLNLTVELKEKK
jgi:hypothetical protein